MPTDQLCRFQLWVFGGVLPNASKMQLYKQMKHFHLTSTASNRNIRTDSRVVSTAQYHKSHHIITTVTSAAHNNVFCSYLGLYLYLVVAAETVRSVSALS